MNNIHWSKFFGFTFVLAISFFVSVLYSQNWVSRSTLYYVAILAVFAIILLAKFNQFPFKEEGRVKSNFFLVVLMLVPLSSIMAMVNSNDRLFWYPTDNGLWGILPYLFLGFVSYIWKAPNFAASGDKLDK